MIFFGSPPSVDHRVAHRREVDHRRHAGEVLHQHARRAEGDLLARSAARRASRPCALRSSTRDGAPVLVAQQVLQQHLQREGQARDVAELRSRPREREVVVAQVADLELRGGRRGCRGRTADPGARCGHGCSPTRGSGRCAADSATRPDRREGQTAGGRLRILRSGQLGARAQDMHRDEVAQEGQPHHAGAARACSESIAGPAGAQDRGRLVQRVPPVDRELDDRQVDRADQAQDRGGARAARRIVERVVERDVAEIEEEQDQDRGEARVPHPERAPHRLAPEAAGDQRDRR